MRESLHEAMAFTPGSEKMSLQMFSKSGHHQWDSKNPWDSLLDIIIVKI